MVKKVIDEYHLEYYCDFCKKFVESPSDMVHGEITGESPFGDVKDISFECCEECKAKFDGKDKVEVVDELLKHNVKYMFEKTLNYYTPLNVVFFDKEDKCD